MKNGKLRVALVGVSFGAEFIPIYLKHPDVDSLVLVDTNFTHLFPHRLGSYVMKRSVSVKFILTIAKSKEQNNRPLVESSLKTIFFFCLSSGFTQGGAVVSRKQNSQPKAISFADVDAGKDPFISRKKKRKCRSCTKRRSKDQISDSADGF